MNSSYFHFLLVLAVSLGGIIPSGSPAAAPDDSQPLAVFLLAGGSNMLGKGVIGDDSAVAPKPGTLRDMVIKNREEKAKLFDYRNEWVVRDDAWLWVRQGDRPPPAADEISMGDLGVGFGATSEMIGPEFGFGHALADHCGQKVVVIKTAWGDSSLYEEFRPPSAVAKRGGTVGVCFTRMIDSYNEALVEIKKQFPGREIQLAGFGWHQGESDRITDLRAKEYAANLEDFIADVRSALGTPKLPVVIASTSMGENWALSTEEGAYALGVENAQLGLDGNNGISVVYTRSLYQPADQSPGNDPSHWNHHGGSLYFLGTFIGRKMIDLCPNLGKGTPPAPVTPIAADPQPKPAPPTGVSQAPRATAISTPPLAVRTSPRPSGSSTPTGSSAAVIHEPFDYPAGPLNGASGGIGFDGPWKADGLSFVKQKSIPFGNLPTSGNSIGNLSPSQNRYGGTRPISASALRDRKLLADGATLWVGLVIGRAPEDASNPRLAIALGNNSFNDAKHQYFIDDKNGSPGSALGITLGRLGDAKGGNVLGRVAATHFRDKSKGLTFEGNVFGSMGAALVPKADQYRFVAGKFTWGADADTLELYAPEEDLKLPRAPISVLKVKVDQGTFDTLTWTRGDAVAFDEIRFGPTYESVCGQGSK